MRESFEKNIESYTEVIHQQLADTSKEGKVRAEGLKQEAIVSGALNSDTTPIAENEIYRIQKQKIEKLRKFKRWLESTRSGEGFVHPESRKDLPRVSQNEDGTLLVEGRGMVTMGELVADVEWGQKYSFDPSVNIHDVRKWHLAELKQDLREKLNAQIIESELADQKADAWKQGAYEKMRERSESAMEKTGIIAEKMVMTFLEELSYDHPDADFEIEPADAHMDVHQKIDFVIHRKQRTHGARIEESAEADTIRVRDVGIQFTTALGKVEQKEKQLRQARKNAKEVDDIVLVTLPLKEASALYKTWDASGRQPGGPMRLWSRDTKAQVFRAVMTHVLTQDEIDSFCEKYF
jgi:hypothetical protein